MEFRNINNIKNAMLKEFYIPSDERDWVKVWSEKVLLSRFNHSYYSIYFLVVNRNIHKLTKRQIVMPMYL